MGFIVFGGNGFVGRYLVQELVKKDRVIVCDRFGGQMTLDAEYVEMDIRKLSDFDKIPIQAGDIVINLAANQYHTKVPKKNRYAYFSDTNTKGVKNILVFMERNKCRNLIQFTTDMTYGKPQYLPVDESHPQIPIGPYGKSKKDAEDICREYRKKGFHITIFRPRMINGPGRLGILEKLFWLVKHNLPVPTIGSGRNCYQMVSVFDCVSAVILAIEHGCPDKEFNLGSENAPSTRRLLQILIKKAGSRSGVIPTPGKLVKLVLAFVGMFGLEIMYKEQYMIADENYILDISKASIELGWRPQYSDQDMIIQAYKDWNKDVR